MTMNPDALLKNASEQLRDDAKFVRDCLDKGSHLCYASERLQDDKDTVLFAVRANGMNLESASARLCADAEVVRAGIEEDGRALFYASERFANDRDLILLAFKNSHESNVLCDASGRLRDDEYVVLTALTAGAENMEFASKRLKDDSFFVGLAEKIAPGCSKYASARLQETFKRIDLK